jgi:integrase
MPLSATAVSSAKAKEKSYKLADAGGLHLLVATTGQRYWRLNYRFQGKYRTLALGVYPDVGLADARAKRDAARKILASGEDPSERRKQEEREAKATSADTFKAIAEEWLSRNEVQGRSVSTMKKLRWLISFAYPTLADRPITQISAPEILDVLRKIEIRGRHETAVRLRGTFGTVFRYAIATGRAQRDVSFDLRGALITPTTKHRAALLKPNEVGELLRAIEAYVGQPTVQVALALAPHLFVRPGELRMAEWREFDLGGAIWTIPAHKTKMRREHKVPLSKQVVAALRKLVPISGNTRFLFPSIRASDRPISDNTLNAALRRLGYDKDQVTAHGFRATASTLLNEMGKWNPDAIERQLGHIDRNEIRRAYARGEYWNERVKMMEAWSNYLDGLHSIRPVLG